MKLTPAKKPAPPSFQDFWRRTFSRGIRQAIFEGFAAMFLIIVMASGYFYWLGAQEGFKEYRELINEDFDRQTSQSPERAAALEQSIKDHQVVEENVEALWVRGRSAEYFSETFFQGHLLRLFFLPIPLLALAVLMASRVTRSIRNLTEVAQAIEQARYGYPLVVEEEDEIGDLAVAMERMRRKIQTSQEELQAANTSLNDKVEEQQYALKQARIIQQNFMPLHYQVKNATVASLFLPQAELSGDFFTFKELTGDRVAFIFGDIQGHGVPASLNMMSIVTSFRLLAEEHEDPAELAAALNMTCGHNATRGPMPLVTAVIGVIHQQDGTVRIVNAGHPAPLLVDTSERTVSEVGQRDPILGLMPDYRYSTSSVQLQPEDKILCYTDGLPECVNNLGEPFERYFHEIVREESFNEPDRFIAILKDRIEQFQGANVQGDDILLSCVSVELAEWEDLTLPPESRESAIKRIVEACAAVRVPHEIISDLHLALDELITNAVLHGNLDDPAKKVQVRYAIGHGVVRIAIHDEGAGFRPDLDEYHLTSEQLMERGRRGIYLVKSLMDEMHYNESGNEVTIVKRYLKNGVTFRDLARYEEF